MLTAGSQTSLVLGVLRKIKEAIALMEVTHRWNEVPVRSCEGGRGKERLRKWWGEPVGQVLREGLHGEDVCELRG